MYTYGRELVRVRFWRISRAGSRVLLGDVESDAVTTVAKMTLMVRISRHIQRELRSPSTGIRP